MNVHASSSIVFHAMRQPECNFCNPFNMTGLVLQPTNSTVVFSSSIFSDNCRFNNCLVPVTDNDNNGLHDDKGPQQLQDCRILYS